MTIFIFSFDVFVVDALTILTISLKNCTKIHYEYGGSDKVTFRKIRDIFGQHNCTFDTAIKNLSLNLSARSILNVPTPKRVRPGRSTQNIAAVS